VQPHREDAPEVASSERPSRAAQEVPEAEAERGGPRVEACGGRERAEARPEPPDERGREPEGQRGQDGEPDAAGVR
jgi:hypothetical protein